MQYIAPVGWRILFTYTLNVAVMMAVSPVMAESNVAADSRIVQVKVYPGSATVERVARVSAGSSSVTFSCLPASLNVQNLQVSADASVEIGETTVTNVPRALAPRCQSSALESHIRELEDQKAALQAESEALDMVTGYLANFRTAQDPTGSRIASAENLTAVAEALRRTSQESLQKKHLIARRQADVDGRLAPLLAERARLQGNSSDVVNVTVALATTKNVDVKLTYQVRGPSWSPSYRAQLDSNASKVRVERQALVAQSTGEDWTGVKLVLSTGQPQRATVGREPNPWRLSVEPPPPKRVVSGSLGMANVADMAVSRVDLAPAPASAPQFNVEVFDSTFTTEFIVARTMDVPSNGKRVAMPLGQHESPARLIVRTSPAVEAAAYLVAEMSQPEGVWPAGPLQLYRDGAFVGNGQWTEPSDENLSLSFGLDELIRVQSESERDNRGKGGAADSQAERRVQHAYLVENRHRIPVTLQVLEAAPVSVDDKVRVKSVFTPQPVELEFNKQQGLVMWGQELNAGEKARFAADYVITYPKGMRLQQQR